MTEARSNTTSINPKFVDKNISKPRGGSPFTCIGSGLSQQMSHDIEEELFSSRQKIEELEALASSRQKEVGQVALFHQLFHGETVPEFLLVLHPGVYAQC